MRKSLRDYARELLEGKAPKPPKSKYWWYEEKEQKALRKNPGLAVIVIKVSLPEGPIFISRGWEIVHHEPFSAYGAMSGYTLKIDASVLKERYNAS